MIDAVTARVGQRAQPTFHWIESMLAAAKGVVSTMPMRAHAGVRDTQGRDGAGGGLPNRRPVLRERVTSRKAAPRSGAGRDQ